MLKRFSWVVGIVLVANAGALALVARNAGGVPDAVVTLTEREMRVTNVGTDSTGMTLSLQWDRDAPYEWLDRAKLTSIGFDCSIDPDAPGATTHYSAVGLLPRTTYVVLDYDPNRIAEPGPGQSGRARPEAANTASPAVLEYAPRLRPVDVGSDRQALRAKYQDRARYIVTAGIVTVWLKRPSPQEPPRLDARVVALLPAEVYVPQSLHATLLAAMGKAGNRESLWLPLRHAPRYEVRVEYGSGLLPRAVGARALSTSDGRR